MLPGPTSNREGERRRLIHAIQFRRLQSATAQAYVDLDFQAIMGDLRSPDAAPFGRTHNADGDEHFATNKPSVEAGVESS